MSVYIKGLDAPESCESCPFDIYGLCLINSNLEGKGALTHSCPLVAVPDLGYTIILNGEVIDNRWNGGKK